MTVGYAFVPLYICYPNCFMNSCIQEMINQQNRKQTLTVSLEMMNKDHETKKKLT